MSMASLPISINDQVVSGVHTLKDVEHYMRLNNLVTFDSQISLEQLYYSIVKPRDIEQDSLIQSLVKENESILKWLLNSLSYTPPHILRQVLNQKLRQINENLRRLRKIKVQEIFQEYNIFSGKISLPQTAQPHVRQCKKQCKLMNQINSLLQDEESAQQRTDIVTENNPIQKPKHGSKPVVNTYFMWRLPPIETLQGFSQCYFGELIETEKQVTYSKKLFTEKQLKQAINNVQSHQQMQKILSCFFSSKSTVVIGPAYIVNIVGRSLALLLTPRHRNSLILAEQHVTECQGCLTDEPQIFRMFPVGYRTEFELLDTEATGKHTGLKQLFQQRSPCPMCGLVRHTPVLAKGVAVQCINSTIDWVHITKIIELEHPVCIIDLLSENCISRLDDVGDANFDSYLRGTAQGNEDLVSTIISKVNDVMRWDEALECGIMRVNALLGHRNWVYQNLLSLRSDVIGLTHVESEKAFGKCVFEVSLRDSCKMNKETFGFLKVKKLIGLCDMDSAVSDSAYGDDELNQMKQIYDEQLNDVEKYNNSSLVMELKQLLQTCVFDL